MRTARRRRRRTGAGRPAPAAPRRPGELARWAWRQLTSMRTALMLLFLLALGSIPGSVMPQQNIDRRAGRAVEGRPPRR